MKILAAALVMIAALAGAAFAFPGWMGMGSWRNMTQNMTGAWHMHWGNSTTPPNSTQVSQFWQAVASDDYQTAKSLHDGFGLGGRIFGMLNQTTFADYSQLYNARAKLWSDLGQNPSSMPHRMHMRGFSRFRAPPSNSSVTEPK